MTALRFLHVGLVATTAFLAACGSDGGGDRTCGVANATQPCDCVGAPGAGVQSCTVDGNWSQCECPGSGDAGNDAVSDAGSDSDSGTDVGPADTGADVGTDAEPDATDASDGSDAVDDVGTDAETGDLPETDVPCPDGDADGVCDEDDACDGFDDADDGDLDGVPDGCDRCPIGADFIDTDSDTAPDACDACPGYDDRLDEDEDGIPDDCDCAISYQGYEVCDGLDNDCDGTVDAGCRPLDPDVLAPWACQPIVNGHYLAAADDGSVFLGTFPGGNSARGSLHQIDREGGVRSVPEPALPWGMDALVRLPDGRVLAGGTGGETFPLWDRQIVELDPVDGSAVAVLYSESFQSTGSSLYQSGITGDSTGGLYYGTADEAALYQVVDTGESALWATGWLANRNIGMSADDGRIYVAAANELRYAAEGLPESVRVHVYPLNTTLLGLAVDRFGRIWLTGVTEEPGIEFAFVDRYDPELDAMRRVVSHSAEHIAIRGPTAQETRMELTFWLSTPDPGVDSACTTAGPLYTIPIYRP